MFKLKKNILTIDGGGKPITRLNFDGSFEEYKNSNKALYRLDIYYIKNKIVYVKTKNLKTNERVNYNALELYLYQTYSLGLYDKVQYLFGRKNKNISIVDLYNEMLLY